MFTGLRNPAAYTRRPVPSGLNARMFALPASRSGPSSWMFVDEPIETNIVSIAREQDVAREMQSVEDAVHDRFRRTRRLEIADVIGMRTIRVVKPT